MNSLSRYNDLIASPSPAPTEWAVSHTHQECTLHQLSPYIGKLKSIIARELILRYTEPGQLVVDMFCGSGTVPLEAACLQRRVFASDASKYAITLTKGKLNAPICSDIALGTLEEILDRVELLPKPDLRRVPKWVRAFFHPRTLKEVLRLTRILRSERHYFYLVSLLGILHHQRPGFLSYPSSHLVPYLRSKKFPRSEYPQLYEYRSIRPRLVAKIKRALRRRPSFLLSELVDDIQLSSACSIELPKEIDCVLTSPPYMNALDYVRDNRLRLWFLGDSCSGRTDRICSTLAGFRSLMDNLAEQLTLKVRKGGYCIFVVGEKTFRGGNSYPSEVLARSFLAHAPTFQLDEVISDAIPDIRRSRKNIAGVKREHILIFRKR